MLPKREHHEDWFRQAVPAEMLVPEAYESHDTSEPVDLWVRPSGEPRAVAAQACLICRTV